MKFGFISFKLRTHTPALLISILQALHCKIYCLIAYFQTSPLHFKQLIFSTKLSLMQGASSSNFVECTSLSTCFSEILISGFVPVATDREASTKLPGWTEVWRLWRISKGTKESKLLPCKTFLEQNMNLGILPSEEAKLILDCHTPQPCQQMDLYSLF